MAIGIVLLSSLLGSFPSSNVVARATGVSTFGRLGLEPSPEARCSGSRASGLAVAGIIDLAKGAAGPLLAGDRPVVAALAGGAAVVVHNWSPFVRVTGGRGIAPALGALLVVAWPGAVLLVVGMLLGKLVGQTALVTLSRSWPSRRCLQCGVVALAR